MRITNNMLISNMMGHLSANLNALARYQAMSETGKLIRRASDDPVIAARSLKLTTNIATIGQYIRNTDSADAWMTTTETAIQSIAEQLQKIKPLAVQASNDTLTDEDRQAIASQVKQFRDELINLANSTYTGRYIFSGYKSDTPLLDENGFFNTVVTQLEKIYYEVGVTNKSQVNVTGDSVFNLGEPVGYLPARAKLVQDIDDFLAMIDARATVTSSVPLDLTGPGVFDMTGASVEITLGNGAAVSVDFDDSGARYVNQMTGTQVIDFLNKRLGLLGTASLEKNGNIVLRDLSGGAGALSVADAGGAAGSAAKLFGAAAAGGSVSAPAGERQLVGTKSMTQPTLDVTGFSPFQIIVDRSSDPIAIDLSAAAPPNVADPTNARLDEVAAEINRQIAAAMADPATNTKWAKCTVEDGRLCITSESFGPQSYIELSGGQEVLTLFGASPTTKQGNTEQQGKLVGSRDFREPVADVTQFSVGGSPSTIRVRIDGTYIATIQLDDGDPAIDPQNMTLRQIMKKIDDQLMGYATCDIDGGKLVVRATKGGPGSTIELSSLDDAFYGFLFGTDPVIRSGANEPTHGYYKAGVAYAMSATLSLGGAGAGGALDVKITFNGASNAPAGPVSVSIPSGVGLMEIADSINEQLLADPATQAFVAPGETNSYRYAVLVDRSGKQLYPPLNGAPYPDAQEELFLVIQSPTWGTGSSVKVEADPPGGANDGAMAALFGAGTVNAPVAMGGVDGLKAEICTWLDTLEEQLGNVTRVWTDLGARMNRVELTKNRLEFDNTVLETLLSENEDANIAYALTMLQMAETVYNASLAAGARVIQPSLIDFLR